MSIENPNGKQPAFPEESIGAAFGSQRLSKFELVAKDVLCAIIASEGVGNSSYPDTVSSDVSRSITYAKVFFETLTLEESEVRNG